MAKMRDMFVLTGGSGKFRIVLDPNTPENEIRFGEPVTRVMRQVVMYRDPKDYPNKYVARAWEIRPGCEPRAAEILAVADTLKRCRRMVPGIDQMFRISADPEDDRAIVEVWV
jgi:hypothetical protein